MGMINSKNNNGHRNLQEMHISEREYQFVDQVQGREKTERHFG